MESPGYQELFYAYKWGLHLLSNKESNFVSTGITQMDQHLESCRETSLDKEEMKYEDRVKLWIRGQRRYKLRSLFSLWSGRRAQAEQEALGS